MKLFHFSIHALVFGCALLVGTTAVAASRFVVTAVFSRATPADNFEHAIPAPVPEEVITVKAFEPINVPAPSADFDPTGTYSLDTDKVPAAFAEIDYLEIATREYVERDGTYTSRPVIPNGMIRTTKDLAFTRISVGNREISFETATKDGISYQFVGHFPVSTEIINCETCEYPADLEGQLRKMKNGKIIAELNARFYVHGC